MGAVWQAFKPLGAAKLACQPLGAAEQLCQALGVCQALGSAKASMPTIRSYLANMSSIGHWEHVKNVSGVWYLKHWEQLGKLIWFGPRDDKDSSKS